MAFALTSFFADGNPYCGPGVEKAVQRVILTATGTTADIDLDIGDDTGTFWTAALANGTYGTMATSALDILQKIISQSTTWQAVYSPEIDASGVRAAAASGTAYTLTFQNSRPNYLFDTAQGLTAYTIVIDYLLKPTIPPTVIAFNKQIP
jgi:hypothetical protein